jgi:hypothetical protein
VIGKLRKRYHEWRLRDIVSDLMFFERNLRAIGEDDDIFALDAAYLRSKIRELRAQKVHHENKIRSLA